MIGSYFKIAFRNLTKHKGFSFINIFGLALGMTVCLLMLMYVVSESSFDNFHSNKDRIYRVWVEWGSDNSKMNFAGSMPAIAPALNENVPEVEAAARLQMDYSTLFITESNEEIEEENLFFADPEIFDILSINLIKGKREQILLDPYTVVISEETAQKYFGNENPIDRTLNYNGSLLKVSGVIESLPSNSHLNCQFLVSYSTLQSLGRDAKMPWNQWGDDLTYFLLRESGDINNVAKQLNSLFEVNAGEWMIKKTKFWFDSITDIHWNTELRGDIGSKGNITYIYLFLSASIFILLIACFNFINLTISKYLERMKEIGVRKVIGANRKQLIIQYLIESILLATLSVLIGGILFQILNEEFYSFLETSVAFSTTNFVYLIMIIVGMILFVGIIAGSYPAIYLSRFKPVAIIKGGSSKSKERLILRKTLVVFQFAISIILILGTIVIFQQINFMKNTNLGFDKNDVILSSFPIKMENGEQKYSVIRDEMLKTPGVIGVSGAYTIPGINSQYNKSVNIKGAPKENTQTFQCLPADYGFIKSIGLTIVEGRDFSKEFSTDASEGLILNESAVNALGLKNPIGTRLEIPGGEASVIGVVKDFHIKSLHIKIGPLFIQLEPRSFIFVVIKIDPENSKQTLASIENTWAGILPDIEFNYRYLEDAYNSYYKTEEKTNDLLSIFTALAIIVSSLGLLGLVYFMTNSRIKEIGIRKVLGASVTNITAMLSKQFAVWVLTANLIAWPAAYYLINIWLQNFAYKVEVGLMPFILAGAFTLLMALFTVGFQTVKAALANPIKSLRYE